MIFIFEDNPAMPISKLINKNVTAIFTEQNYQLMYYTKEQRSIHPEEKIIVFVDYAINNKDTRDLYVDLVTEFIDDANIRVIPIPCIEFIAMCCLESLNMLGNSKLALLVAKTMSARISTLSASDITRILSYPSTEKFYKNVLNQLFPHCVRNINGDKIEGFFYTNDCLCNGAKNYCVNKSLREKWLVFSKYLDYNNVILFNTIKGANNKIATEYYNSLAKSLGLAISVNIVF